MKQLFGTKRERDTARDEAQAKRPEDAAGKAPATAGYDVKLIVGPPGCCGTSEFPARKQRRRR